MERIVVGVDGSPESKAALAWAGEEARLRGDRVVAVRVCTPHAVGPVPWSGRPVTIPAPAEVEERAREALAADVEAVLGHDRTVEQRVVRGDAAEALVDLACDAKLLVVGSRGHGRLAGVVLGSVSRDCAQHAPCPVVVVRPGAARLAA